MSSKSIFDPDFKDSWKNYLDEERRKRLARVMTPRHPRWDGFQQKLLDAVHGPETCDHTPGNAAAILAAMGDVDVEESLRGFQTQAGYCDCTIILNWFDGGDDV
jgi:hypothetical protein